MRKYEVRSDLGYRRIVSAASVDEACLRSLYAWARSGIHTDLIVAREVA
jgi:hypothetical protein